jgi:polysaccharide biosynthesis protein PslH
MRVLLLSPLAFYPPRHGTGARIYSLASALNARHDVIVVFFDRPERLHSSRPVPGLDAIGLPLAERSSGRLTRWLSRFGMLRWSPASAANLAVIRETISSRAIDAVIAQDLLLAPLLPALRALPLVWATEGIFSDLRHPSLRPRRNPYRRLQEWLAYLEWRRLERWTWHRADVLVAVSEAEADVLRRRTNGRKPVVVAPNAVSVDSLAGVARMPTAPPRVLFVGSGWQPNVEALNFFASSILPLVRGERADLVLSVAGRVCDSRNLRLPAVGGVERLGFVEDLQAEYARAACLVAPILSGHGTRMKIIEAMAAGVPVVSTRKGAEGLDLRVGEEILIANEPLAFARAILSLVEDPALAARVGAAGRERVRRDYDSERAARLIETALELATRQGAGLAGGLRSSGRGCTGAARPAIRK